MIIQICVGSSCHIKGSEEIVRLFEESLQKYKLESDITLVGSFCTGQCNRLGVTVVIDDVIHTGVTPESFDAFFSENVLNILGKEV
ncbi:MAG: (2Fe-2S) ferredoxin domain-containing protein [Eubacteriales bacterium]|nr:(2Fe-2S) ferredoxin domain-containing protein [Eubacteriales bacterium]